MNKKKVVTSNIQTNHTLGEYQRYFSHLLAKGKLHRYDLSEKDKLDPKRQYWKITDEKGKTYYYELPKYIKPSDTKSAYSLRRVTHRRPTRIALAIFAGTAIVSFTSAIVTKRVFAPHFPDVPPQPVDLEGLQKKLHDFQEWKKTDPTGDATKSFSVANLASTAIANALYDPNSYYEEEGVGHYLRRPLLTVGFGFTDTTVIPSIIEVHVDVTNSFRYDTINALEESISFSSSGMAPEVGRRDFYLGNNKKVESHKSDKVESKIDATWQKQHDKEFKEEDYINQVGKYPDNPFLYSVTEDTVLDTSTAIKTNDGYVITMDLDADLSVVGYRFRMKYLSNKAVGKFDRVQLTFSTDDELQLKTSEVNESYEVDSGIELVGYVPTIGKLKTQFYYGENVPSIPSDRTEPFNYRPYQAE